MSATQATALDYEIVRSPSGRRVSIRVESDIYGLNEHFIFSYEDPERKQQIRLTQYVNGNENASIVTSANFVNVIHFNGDNEDDTVENNTDVPMFAHGNGGDDVLIGSDFADSGDRLFGGPGMDFLYGRRGRDTLIPGDDLLEGAANGGDGNDEIIRREYAVDAGFIGTFGVRQRFAEHRGGEPVSCEVQTPAHIAANERIPVLDVSRTRLLLEMLSRFGIKIEWNQML